MPAERADVSLSVFVRITVSASERARWAGAGADRLINWLGLPELREALA
jgi:hypothetical protein